MRGHLAPGELARPGHVVEARDALPGDVLEAAHDVVLLDELHERVIAGDRRTDRSGQVRADGRDDVGPEHVGESKDRDDRGGIVLGEVPDEPLDLEQGALDPGPGGRGARHLLRNHVGSVDAEP